eukprot:667071_1
MSVELSIGDCVLVQLTSNDSDNGECIGLIKYIGMIHNPQYLMKEFVGIELLQPIKHGHDGIINGYQYFDAPMGHGICIPIHHVIRKIQTTELFKKLQDITCRYLKTVRKTETNRIPPYINDKSIDSFASTSQYTFKSKRTSITAASPSTPVRRSSTNTDHLDSSRKISTITESETKPQHKLRVDVNVSDDESSVTISTNVSPSDTLHALSPSTSVSTNVSHQISIDSMIVNGGISIDPARASVLKYHPPPQLHRQKIGANIHSLISLVQSDSGTVVDDADPLLESNEQRYIVDGKASFKQRDTISKKVII